MKGKRRGFTVDSILDKGLRSKVLWAIYLNPSRAYQVSKFIYGKGDSRNGTIGKYLKEFEKLGYVKCEEKQYSVKTEKLVEEINKFLPEKIFHLNQEEEQILFHLLESKTIRGGLRLETRKIFQKRNLKDGGFLADLFTRLSITAKGKVDNSGLEKRKPDLKKECRALNKRRNETESLTEIYTIDTLFREKMTELDNQYLKLENYVYNKKKLKTNKNKTDFEDQYLLFYYSYWNKAFSFIPLEMLKKIQYLNYLGAMSVSDTVQQWHRKFSILV